MESSPQTKMLLRFIYVLSTENLYTEEFHCRPMLDGLTFNVLQREDASWLERPFEEDEVTMVVRSIEWR